jgi:hypothetical protein
LYKNPLFKSLSKLCPENIKKRKKKKEKRKSDLTRINKLITPTKPKITKENRKKIGKGTPTSVWSKWKKKKDPSCYETSCNRRVTPLRSSLLLRRLCTLTDSAALPP